jgi:hypothetical protein
MQGYNCKSLYWPHAQAWSFERPTAPLGIASQQNTFAACISSCTFPIKTTTQDFCMVLCTACHKGEQTPWIVMQHKKPLSQTAMQPKEGGAASRCTPWLPASRCKMYTGGTTDTLPCMGNICKGTYKRTPSHVTQQHIAR